MDQLSVIFLMPYPMGLFALSAVWGLWMWLSSEPARFRRGRWLMLFGSTGVALNFWYRIEVSATGQ